MLKSFLFEKTNSIFQWGLQWKLQFNSFSSIHSEGSLNFRTWNARWNNKLHWFNPVKSIICWQLLHCLCDEIFLNPKSQVFFDLSDTNMPHSGRRNWCYQGKLWQSSVRNFSLVSKKIFFEIVKKFAHGNF